MPKFVGMKRKAGPYEIKDDKTGEVTKTGNYHNFYMHYIDDAELGGENLQDTTSNETFIAKIKYENAAGVFGFDIKDLKQFDDWYLKDIEVFFNRKGEAVSVRLVDETTKKSTKGA